MRFSDAEEFEFDNCYYIWNFSSESGLNHGNITTTSGQGLSSCLAKGSQKESDISLSGVEGNCCCNFGYFLEIKIYKFRSNSYLESECISS